MVDFGGVVYPKDLGYDEKLVHYSSTVNSDSLRLALDNLDITANDSILDVGCGKGAAMKTLMEYPFAKVDGIELMREVAEIAISNFQELKVDTKIICGDACQFDSYGDYNYLYLFNPFPKEIFTKFLIQLLSQIKSPITIIYCTPHQRALLEESGFELIKSFPVANTVDTTKIYRK